jgi:hypothetical protein
MKSRESKEWRAAMNKELANLRCKSVWKLKHPSSINPQIQQN